MKVSEINSLIYKAERARAFIERQHDDKERIAWEMATKGDAEGALSAIIGFLEGLDVKV